MRCAIFDFSINIEKKVENLHLMPNNFAQYRFFYLFFNFFCAILAQNRTFDFGVGGRSTFDTSAEKRSDTFNILQDMLVPGGFG